MVNVGDRRQSRSPRNIAMSSFRVRASFMLLAHSKKPRTTDTGLGCSHNQKAQGSKEGLGLKEQVQWESSRLEEGLGLKKKREVRRLKARRRSGPEEELITEKRPTTMLHDEEMIMKRSALPRLPYMEGAALSKAGA